MKFLPVICALVALCGCTTTQLTPEQLEARLLARIESITRTVVYIGARKDLKANPAHRPYYVQSLNGLIALEFSAEYTPKAFSDALLVTGNSTFENENAVLTLTIIPELLDLATASTVAIDNPVNVRAAVKGAKTGLTLALQ